MVGSSLTALPRVCIAGCSSSDDLGFDDSQTQLRWRCWHFRRARLLEWSSNGELPQLDAQDAKLAIETEDNFWITCDRVEVKSVRPYNLADEVDEKGP